jgi:YNFM family putative membrane transporter
MAASVIASSLLGLLVPLCHDFRLLLGVRFLLGIALAGLPAVAMAYLAEEIPPSRLGAAMGIYIAGNAVGGMSGRLTVGLLTDAFTWRTALLVQAAACLAASIWFARNLPGSQHFRPAPVSFRTVVSNLGAAASSPALRPLYAIPFLVMGNFSAVYNYIAFLLMKPPYSLDHAQVGYIFLLYLVGTVGSASFGRMADSIGRARVLPIGIALQACGAFVTLAPPLWLKIAGVGLFTFGFFGAHATASGWVGARSGNLKATAATLYLLAYYAGVTVGGWVGGYFWIHLGWNGVVLMVGLFLGAALAIALRMGREAGPALALP